MQQSSPTARPPLLRKPPTRQLLHRFQPFQKSLGPVPIERSIADHPLHQQQRLTDKYGLTPEINAHGAAREYEHSWLISRLPAGFRILCLLCPMTVAAD